MIRKLYILLSALALVSLLTAGCGDFLTGEMLDKSPNAVTEVQASASFVAVQAKMFLQFNGHLNRGLNVWMEHFCGTDRQYSGLSRYENTEGQFNGEFNSWYSAGGLIDIRRVRAGAEAGGNRVFLGMAKFWEALMMGTAASLWGDVPYSEAVGDVMTPKLDTQESVYTAVQALLTEAIADLGSLDEGSIITPSGSDFVYGGDPDKWIEACYTLKARFHLHLAKKVPANINLALTAAGNGISSTANNFQAKFSTTAGEQNMFYQYEDNREGYMVTGKYFVDMLIARGDPRLDLYIEDLGGGSYVGAAPGEDYVGKSNINPNTFRARDWPLDILSFEETQFIIAECQSKLGDDAAARAAANAAIDGIWARYTGNSYFDETAAKPDLSALSGAALFEEIMLQKYISTFANIEVYNDWKRTGIPNDLLGPGLVGLSIPRRPLYSDTERNANPNIPSPDAQPVRNWNDPTGIY